MNCTCGRAHTPPTAPGYLTLTCDCGARWGIHAGHAARLFPTIPRLRCSAVNSTDNMYCRRWARVDGMCGPHYRRERDRARRAAG